MAGRSGFGLLALRWRRRWARAGFVPRLGPAGRHATFDGVHRLEGVCLRRGRGWALQPRSASGRLFRSSLSARRACASAGLGACGGAGLADLLGPVNVRFEDLAETTT